MKHQRTGDLAKRYRPHLISMHHRAFTEQLVEHLQRLTGLHRAGFGRSKAFCAQNELAQLPNFSFVDIDVCCAECAAETVAMQQACHILLATCLAASVSTQADWGLAGS